MVEIPLTKEQILDTAEQVFRRFGIEKSTVVDVARALNVSHGTLYRHFPSKVAIREAVAHRWLRRISYSLEGIHALPERATARLRRWLDTLIQLKRSNAVEDPELFAMYLALSEEAIDVVQAHLNELVLQLTRIIEEGIQADEFKSDNASTSASAVFTATIRFHHPGHANEWTSPTIDQEYEHVWNLIMTGLYNNSKDK
ncbi:TetR family transcriptional regulator [Paenibacillus sp. SI8]|uniref:TetR family transcriptional regulator n=1 Tax=unclassified Paenibacillus TaxID=185978 RepID=UPI003465F35C